MEVEGSPVFDEYARQVANSADGLVDLTALWRAAGRPRGRSPRQWDAIGVRHGCESEIVRDDGGPDGAVWATEGDALMYAARALDSKIMDALVAEIMRRTHADPARCLMECPDPLMGLLTGTAMMVDRSISMDEARERLSAEVVERTTDRDPYEQETIVARAQRALRGDTTPEI